MIGVVLLTVACGSTDHLAITPVATTEPVPAPGDPLPIGDGAVDSFGGWIPDGQTLSPFDGSNPAITQLDPALLHAIQDAARNAKSAVVTFDRHPATIVRPESAPKLLTDHEQRMELFEETCIDAAVVLPFDERQAQEPPLAFVEPGASESEQLAHWLAAQASIAI